MITIPLYTFLFAFLFFLLFFLGFFLVNVGHLFRTGTFTLVSFISTFFFLALSALVLWGLWYTLQGIDWQMPVTLWSSGWNSGVNTSFGI